MPQMAEFGIKSAIDMSQSKWGIAVDNGLRLTFAPESGFRVETPDTFASLTSPAEPFLSGLGLGISDVISGLKVDAPDPLAGLTSPAEPFLSGLGLGISDVISGLKVDAPDPLAGLTSPAEPFMSGLSLGISDVISGLKVDAPDPFAGLTSPAEPFLSGLSLGISDVISGLKVDAPDPFAGLTSPAEPFLSGLSLGISDVISGLKVDAPDPFAGLTSPAEPFLSGLSLGISDVISGLKVDAPDPFAGLTSPAEPFLSGLSLGISDVISGLKVDAPDPLAGLTSPATFVISNPVSRYPKQRFVAESFHRTETAFDPPLDGSLASFDRLIAFRNLSRRTRTLFADGHYAASVERAFIYVENLVKTRSGLSGKYGANLMRTVFSANDPCIALNARTTDSDRDEQLGYMDIFAGSMTGIRNPRAHESDWYDSAEEALELLVIANHLVRKIERAV